MRRSSPVRNSIITAFAAVALMCGASVPSAYAATCCAVGNSGCIYNSPLHFNTGTWTNLCSSITTLSGQTCTAVVDAGTGATGSVSSGDCISIGAGVTLNLNDAQVKCTGTNCGSGILNTSSSNTSTTQVSVTGGYVLGCFSSGVAFTGGTSSTLSGTTVDYAPLGSTCTNALNSCVLTPRGTTSKVQLHNCFSGVNLSAGEDVNDSFIEGSYIGVYGQGTSSISTLNNVSLTGNVYDMINTSTGGTTYKIKVVTSSLQQTSGCPCADSSGNCVTTTSCMNFFSNSVGNATYVEKEKTFYP